MRVLVLLTVALAVALSSSSTLAQVDTLPGERYGSGDLRITPHGASGCPSQSCQRGALATADNGAWCVCSSAGAWVATSSAAALAAHLTDAEGAHAATAISYDDTETALGSSTAQGAIAATVAAMNEHVNATDNPHGVGAAQVAITDTRALYDAADVEAALAEVMDAVVDLALSTGAALIGFDATDLTHAAGLTVQSAISGLDGGIVTALGAAQAAQADVDSLETILVSTANGDGASVIAIEDAAGQFTSENVESALAEALDAAQAAQADATQGVNDAATVAGNLSTHTGNTGNPHSVTAAQAGAIALSLATGADLFLYATGAGAWGVKNVSETQTILDVASLTALALSTGGGLIGSSDLGTGWGAGSTVEERLDDMSGDVATVEGIASAAMPTATLASTANGQGASLIGIEDSGGLVTATTVEGAIAELAATSGGTPAPVYLGHLSIDAIWEQAQSTNIQYTGAAYDWSTTGRSFGFFWPYTRLTAAHASWGLEVQCRIAAAQVDTAVAFDCRNRAGSDFCTEWTDSTWTGSLTEESSTITFSGSLPTADDFLFVAWHSDGTDILRVFYCAAYAVAL